MRDMQQSALDLIDALQRELESLSFDAIDGPHNLRQVYGKQLDMMRAHVEHHRAWVRAESMRPARMVIP